MTNYLDRRTRGIAVWAAVAFGMMLVGSIGTGVGTMRTKRGLEGQSQAAHIIGGKNAADNTS
jgi:hypothetical protein